MRSGGGWKGAEAGGWRRGAVRRSAVAKRRTGLLPRERGHRRLQPLLRRGQRIQARHGCPLSGADKGRQAQTGAALRLNTSDQGVCEVISSSSAAALRACAAARLRCDVGCREDPPGTPAGALRRARLVRLRGRVLIRIVNIYTVPRCFPENRLSISISEKSRRMR